MKISGIYKIQSKIKPERIYIGSAVNIKNRWNNHLKALRKGIHNNKLQRHYNKYGEADLQFSILLGCGEEDLLKTEQYFLDSYNPYFNICRKAGSVLGCKWKLSEETKKKMSNSRMGFKASKETRTKQSNAAKKRGSNNKGKHWKLTNEQNICKSKRQKGRERPPITEETRRKMSEAQKRIGNKPPLYKGKNFKTA